MLDTSAWLSEDLETVNGSVHTLVQKGLERYRGLETEINVDLVMWWCEEVEVRCTAVYLYLQRLQL